MLLAMMMRRLHLPNAAQVSEIALSKVPTFRAAYGAVGTHATPKALKMRKGGVAVSFTLGGTSSMSRKNAPPLELRRGGGAWLPSTGAIVAMRPAAPR